MRARERREEVVQRLPVRQIEHAETDPDLGRAAMEQVVCTQADIDDVLDAAAAAWSARRIAAGEAISLPAHPPVDTRGRPIAIWA